MQHTKEEIRRRLLAAALDEFECKGYADASMRDIVANAGSSLGNLYRYYESKQALFLAVVSPAVNRCIDSTRAGFELSPDKLHRVAELMARYFTRYRREFKALSNGPAEYYSGFLSSFARCIAEKVREYVNATFGGKPDGIRNPHFYEVAAAAFISGMRIIMESFEDERTTAEYIEELLRFVFGDLDKRLI